MVVVAGLSGSLWVFAGIEAASFARGAVCELLLETTMSMWLTEACRWMLDLLGNAEATDNVFAAVVVVGFVAALWAERRPLFVMFVRGAGVSVGRGSGGGSPPLLFVVKFFELLICYYVCCFFFFSLKKKNACRCAPIYDNGVRASVASWMRRNKSCASACLHAMSIPLDMHDTCTNEQKYEGKKKLI
jgi:hypothetical protein